MSNGSVSPFAWVPSPEFIAATRETEFLEFMGLGSFEDLDALGRQDAARFWDGVIKFAGLQFYEPYHTVIDDSAGIEWARWCVGGRTNLVLNCIDRWRGTPTYDRIFLIWCGEDGAERTFSYRQFDQQMSRFASALETLGVQRGEVVALYLPLIPETLMAYFAAIKIGAVAMPLFSGFGAAAVRARLELAGAKVVVTADGTLRRDPFSRTPNARDPITKSTPSRVIGSIRCSISPG
jgi:acetyl-CoA synthetase